MEGKNVRAAPGVDLIFQCFPILLWSPFFVGDSDVRLYLFVIVYNCVNGGLGGPKIPVF